MTDIKTALYNATLALTNESSTPRIDAEVLLAHMLNVNRAFLYAHGTDKLNEVLHQSYQTLLLKRLTGTPIAYLTGQREFWSLPLHVNENTLIPRPETELLVEKTLELLHDKPEALILELGTGSGAISLALAKERPNWKILACDKYKETLNIAKLNAQQFQLDKITFILSDWFESLPKIHFDAIISNPPYLAESDPHQYEGDLRFEPKHALTSAQDGFLDIQTIIQNAPDFLKKKGLLMLEHGYQQGSTVRDMLSKNNFSQIISYKDIEERERMTIGWQ